MKKPGEEWLSLAELDLRTRYPVDVGIEGSPLPSRKTAELFLELAEFIFDAAERLIAPPKTHRNGF